MSGLSRIGVAIDTDLLEKFDRLIAQRKYTNRSEAFRDLIRDELVEKTPRIPSAALCVFGIAGGRDARCPDPHLRGPVLEEFQAELGAIVATAARPPSLLWLQLVLFHSAI
jgi:hypothetical protein